MSKKIIIEDKTKFYDEILEMTHALYKERFGSDNTIAMTIITGDPEEDQFFNVASNLDDSDMIVMMLLEAATTILDKSNISMEGALDIVMRAFGFTSAPEIGNETTH